MNRSLFQFSQFFPFPPLFLSVLLFIFTTPAFAESTDFTFNGHLRGQSNLNHYNQNHILSQLEDQTTFVDGSVDFRLNSTAIFSDDLKGYLAWEAAATGGQNRKALSNLANQSTAESLFRNISPNDDTQLFDLTFIVHESDELLVYHRLDRLFFSYDTGYGLVKTGRQPLTWGNGLLFNPVDLVNPFAPSDIIRDYKAGADMLLYQWGGETVSDLQVAVVPGRNPQNDEVEMDETTIGSSIKLSLAERDFDFYLLKNHQDPVIGAGLTSFLGGAAFRTDWTLTFLQDDPGNRTVLSFVTNIDYSWVWNDHNWYGFVELYHSGFGADSVREGLTDTTLMERINRGELFGTGRWYLDWMLQYEAHPLVNCYLTTILNLKDGSFLLQPRVNWDIAESLQMLVGLDIPVGSEGDEFGELKLDDSATNWGQGQRLYLLLTWYF